MTQYGNETAEWGDVFLEIFQETVNKEMKPSKILHLLGLFVISDLIKLP